MVGVMASSRVSPHRSIATITTWVLLCAALFAVRPVGVFAADGTTALVAGNTAFALDLYGRLKSGEGNLFFSPYSISTCLAMTYAGARGETEAQMARTLHFNADQSKFHAEFGELQNELNTIQEKKDVELNIANGLWAQAGHPFLPAFLDTATKMYDAKLKQVNFRTDAEPARKEINDWVSDRTKGKITDLIAPGVLDASTRLVLVNAIYFKGKWLHQFKKTSTADAPFSVSRDRKIQTKMMNQSANFGYADLGTLQLVELTYRGGGVSMVVLLPREIDGLKALENSLNPKQLDDWTAHARVEKVSVFLPKFKLTRQFELGKTLAGMGMADAFSPRADFSGMDGMKDLFISEVIHKAFVEVNEEGTEAAAATAAVMVGMAMQRPQPAPVFRADHPFLFLIRDTHSGSILFMGRVTSPAE